MATSLAEKELKEHDEVRSLVKLFAWVFGAEIACRRRSNSVFIFQIAFKNVHLNARRVSDFLAGCLSQRVHLAALQGPEKNPWATPI